MGLQKYATAAERKVAKKLIKLILETGNVISVYDGEEWVLKRSANPSDIANELCASDEGDTIQVQCSEREGIVLGAFYLVFDDIQDDGIVVINDYTANEFSDAIYNQL
jgi:hypothetical protein